MESVKRKNVKRDIRHGMRGESARRCIGPITKGCDIFGLTKGDFSKIDILKHIVDEIGPCNVDIGTWTAANGDLTQAMKMFNDNRLLKVRFLVDRSFITRKPADYGHLMKMFGRDSIRTAIFHAKYILAENDEFSIALRTSMNLNLNKRIESYEISEGSPISDYLREITDHHFSLPQGEHYDAFKQFNLSGPNTAKPSTSRLGDWD